MLHMQDFRLSSIASGPTAVPRAIAPEWRARGPCEQHSRKPKDVRRSSRVSCLWDTRQGGVAAGRFAVYDERLPPMQRSLTQPLSSAPTERAVRWLLRSGIQEASGGVARFHRRDTGCNAAVSTEITAYAVSAFLWLHETTGDRECLSAALRAGAFLAARAWDEASGCFLCELPGNGAAGQAYFFDTGIIARAFLALWRTCGDPAHLRLACAAADSMAGHFPDGRRFHAILALPRRRPIDPNGRWSHSPGCYQLKAALAWRELGEEGDRRDDEAAWTRALQFALDDAAVFPLREPHRERMMDRLHAYCYYLEGLLGAARNPDAARALARGIDRVAALFAQLSPALERCDVSAQLLRLRVFAAALGVVRLNEGAAEAEAERIADYQIADTDPRLDGGFCFGRQGGALLPHVNPASTIFCLQALEFWRRYHDGSFDADWRKLI